MIIYIIHVNGERKTFFVGCTTANLKSFVSVARYWIPTFYLTPLEHATILAADGKFDLKLVEARVVICRQPD